MLINDNRLKVELKDIIFEFNENDEPTLFVDVEIENHSDMDLNVGTNFLYVNNSMLYSNLKVDIPKGEIKLGRISFEPNNLEELCIHSKSDIENIGLSFIGYPIDGYVVSSCYESEYVELSLNGTSALKLRHPIYKSDKLNVYSLGYYFIEDVYTVLMLYIENLTDIFTQYNIKEFKLNGERVSCSWDNEHVLGHKNSVCSILLDPNICEIDSFECIISAYNYDPADYRELYRTDLIEG